MSHTVTVKCAAMPYPPLEFTKITGGERLSEPYCYTIILNTPGDPNIPRQVAANADYKQMIGKEFTVEIELGDLSKREISGLVTNARILDGGRQQSQYEVTIEPWLILATRTSDYKRFQGKTVVQILDEVLADYPFPVEKRLIEKYPVLEYQVQYGETDFDFMQRLMEEWGIYWFFEHSGGKHRLILIDNMGAHKPPPSADYHSLVYDTDGGVGKEHLSAFNAIQTHRPGQWVTDDFDFKKPRKKLQITDVKPRQTAFPSQELYLWPGDYMERDVGKHLAEVRMQAAGVIGSLAYGSGNLPGVPCGCTCSVEDYPADKANREYLAVASMLDLTEIGKTSGQGEYRCDAAFEFLPTNTVFRPKLTIKKPRTTGPQTAVVVGPPGEEIYTNEYGQIKVQFHWDRYGKNDQDSSCWIRVSYPWAGSNFGGIHLPRIGQEVVVDFENGDPDRPIVTGRVYNGLNMPPWKLPDNATQSGVLTRSSKEGGQANANALRFEDKKGEEEIWLHAEKDQCIEVEHDESHWVGNDRSKTIDGNETTIVHKNRTETVDMDEVITIHQNRQKTIDINETDKIGNNWTIDVDNNKKETVGMNYMENTGVSKMMNIGMAYSRNVGMAMNSLVGVIQASEVGLTKKLLVGRDYSANIGKTVKLDVGDKKTETVGKVSIHTVGDHLELVCGQARIVLTSEGGIYLKGSHIELQARSALNGDADMIHWNCEKTQAVVGSGKSGGAGKHIARFDSSIFISRYELNLVRCMY